MTYLKKLCFATVVSCFFLLLGELCLLGVALIQQQMRQRAHSDAKQLVITLGDSVTQGGYPRPLQEQLQSYWTVLDLAASGRGMDYVVDTIHSKTDDWSKSDAHIFIMIGHNDCMYLQSFAQLHNPTEIDSSTTRSHRFLRSFRTYRLLVQIVARFRPEPPAPTLIREPPPRLGSTQELRYCQQTIDSGIAEINAWNQHHRHTLTLLSYPIPNELNPQDQRPDHLMQVNRLVNKLLAQSAKKYDINWIDTATCMAHQPRSYWESDAVHLTNNGDKAFANCILLNTPFFPSD